jgi:hypothetical protein
VWNIWSAKSLQGIVTAPGLNEAGNGGSDVGRISDEYLRTEIDFSETEQKYECPGRCIRQCRWSGRNHEIWWPIWFPWMGNMWPPQAQNAFSVGRGTALLGVSLGLTARAPLNLSLATVEIRLNNTLKDYYRASPSGRDRRRTLSSGGSRPLTRPCQRITGSQPVNR